MKISTTQMLGQIAESVSDVSKLLFSKPLTDADMNEKLMEAVCCLEVASREMKLCLADQYNLTIPEVRTK